MKIIICTLNQYRDAQGIHLRSPDAWYMNDAIRSAERDGFNAIYIHADTRGTNNFVLNGDVLNILFEMSKTGTEIQTIHPCETVVQSLAFQLATRGGK